MARKLHWNDLTTAQRVALVVTVVGEVIVTGKALRDLARRPASMVRGPKLLWALLCFVQPVGPATYLRFGRRP